MTTHYYTKHEKVDGCPRLKKITVKYYKGGSAAVVTDHNLSEEEMHDLKIKAKENGRIFGRMQ
jgi:hypothetical protein